MSIERRLAQPLGFALILLLLGAIAAESVTSIILVGEQTLWVPGIYIAENGSFIGLPSKLNVKALYPGEGKVYFSTEPLTQVDTQAAARIAALIASLYANTDPLSVDWLISLESNTTTIGGPSASAATALAMYAVLTGRRIPRNISLTGMIDIDGSIGPVGGVVAKLRAMARMGVKIFFIPAGEEVTYEIKRLVEHRDGVTIERETRIPVNVTKLGYKLGVRVIPVVSFAQLLEYVFDVKLPRINPRLPAALKKHLESVTHEYLSVAVSNFTRASKLYEEYRDRIRGSFGGLLDGLYNATRRLLDDSRRALQNGEYYVAASKAFAAAIEATQLNALLNIVKEHLDKGVNVLDAARRIVESYTSAARRILRDVNESLAALLSRRDVNALQVAIAVFDRMEEANNTVNAALASLEERDFVDAVLNAVYSYYRARTAEDWINAYNLIGPGPSYSISRLVRTLRMFTSYAEMLDTYLTDIGISNQYVMQARTNLDLLDTLQARGAPPEELLPLAINAIVYYALAVHAQYGTAAHLYNASRETALYAYHVVSRSGVTPILAASYIEAGDAASDPFVKIEFYSRAATILLVLYTLLAQGRKPPVLHNIHNTSDIMPHTTPASITTGEQSHGGENTTTTSIVKPSKPSSSTGTATTTESGGNDASSAPGAGNVNTNALEPSTLATLAVIIAGIVAGIVLIAAYGTGRL